jgi:hypothetical protein
MTYVPRSDAEAAELSENLDFVPASRSSFVSENRRPWRVFLSAEEAELSQIPEFVLPGSSFVYSDAEVAEMSKILDFIPASEFSFVPTNRRPWTVFLSDAELAVLSTSPDFIPASESSFVLKERIHCSVPNFRTDEEIAALWKNLDFIPLAYSFEQLGQLRPGLCDSPELKRDLEKAIEFAKKFDSRSDAEVARLREKLYFSPSPGSSFIPQRRRLSPMKVTRAKRRVLQRKYVVSKVWS